MKTTIIAMVAAVLASPAYGLSQNLTGDSELKKYELEITKGFRRCPPPYTNILGECFYVHMFIPLMTWEEARTFCIQAGGILAEPTHFGAIVAHLYNNDLARKIYDGLLNNLWVGGHMDRENTTAFRWTSGRPINEKIVSGVPGNIYFHGDAGDNDCVLLTMNKMEPFLLQPFTCNFRTHYICQYP